MSKLTSAKNFNPAIKVILENTHRKAKELQRKTDPLNQKDSQEQEYRILQLCYDGMGEITGEYIRHCQRLHQRGILSMDTDQRGLQMEFKKLLDNSTRRLWDSVQNVFKSGEISSGNNLFSMLEKHGVTLENQVKQFLLEEQSKRREDIRVTRTKIKIPLFRKALALLGLNLL